jgi:hypothetical protein
MISKVIVTRISAVLFLGGLVALLIGLTLSPHFANAGGGQDCSGLLANHSFRCSLEGSGQFFLDFDISNVSGLFVHAFPLNTSAGTIDVVSDCLCVGAVKNVLCQDVTDSGVILHGRIVNSTALELEGKVIVTGEGPPVGFSCFRLP